MNSNRKLIDAYRFEEELYHEAFERDSDMQRWDSGCWIRYKLFERMLEKQPAVNVEPHWIPVSEGLPKVAGLYIVTDSKGDVVRFVFENTETSREYWKRCAKAWMPSPKPYEVKDEKTD